MTRSGVTVSRTFVNDKRDPAEIRDFMHRLFDEGRVEIRDDLPSGYALIDGELGYVINSDEWSGKCGALADLFAGLDQSVPLSKMNGLSGLLMSTQELDCINWVRPSVERFWRKHLGDKIEAAKKVMEE